MEYKETDEFGKDDSFLANIARTITFFVYVGSLLLLVYNQKTSIIDQDTILRTMVISLCLFFGLITPTSQRKSFDRFLHRKEVAERKRIWQESMRDILYAESKQRTGHLFNDTYTTKYFDPFALALTSHGALEAHRALYEVMKVQVERNRQKIKEKGYRDEIVETAKTLERLLVDLEGSRNSQVFIRHPSSEKRVLRLQIVAIQRLLNELEGKEPPLKGVKRS